MLFLNNAINHGVLTPLGLDQSKQLGHSALFLLEADPGPGAGLLLAFMLFGRGVSKATAPGAFVIQFFGGIHEVYFPYVLAKPRLLLALIAGGATGTLMNVIFGSGLVAPAAPGSIFAVYSSLAKGSAVGVTLCWSSALVVTFVIASLLLKFERSDEEIDLAAATAQMEANKGKKSSVAGVLTGQRAQTGEIQSIVFACDAGMGSSAMGASVLRKKVHDAGFPEVTVVNKAISNLEDDFDLVVTHRDLSDRARAKTPSAVLVPVDNFMASPRYDEIVELVRESKGGAGAAAGSATGGTHAAAPAEGTGMPGGLLSDDAIVLDAPAGESRDISFTRAGGLLVAAGAVDRSYVDAMHERETSVSTAMGNLLAIPHGTNEAKSAVSRTALSFVRYPEPIDWNGKPVRYVVGIAAVGNEHLKLLGRIAEVFVDPEQVARLESATSPADVRAVLGEVAPV